MKKIMKWKYIKIKIKNGKKWINDNRRWKIKKQKNENKNENEMNIENQYKKTKNKEI